MLTGTCYLIVKKASGPSCTIGGKEKGVPDRRTGMLLQESTLLPFLLYKLIKYNYYYLFLFINIL